MGCITDRKIAEYFKNSTVVYHDRGHYMLQNAEIKGKVYDFLMNLSQ